MKGPFNFVLIFLIISSIISHQVVVLSANKNSLKYTILLTFLHSKLN